MTNEMIMNILQTVVTAILLPLLGYGVAALKKLIDEKVKDTVVARHLKSASDAVGNAVEAVTQTYVDNLKGENLFDKEAQENAFMQALEMAKKTISKDGQKIIGEIYGDFNEWLTVKIESTVHKNKV